MVNTGVFGKLTPSGVDVIVETRSVNYGHTCTHDFGWLIACREKRSQNGRSLTENSLVCCATEFLLLSCKGDLTRDHDVEKKESGSTRVHTFKYHVIPLTTGLYPLDLGPLIHIHPDHPSIWPLIYWLFIWCFAQ